MCNRSLRARISTGTEMAEKAARDKKENFGGLRTSRHVAGFTESPLRDLRAAGNVNPKTEVLFGATTQGRPLGRP
jgi:hypothetical protein